MAIQYDAVNFLQNENGSIVVPDDRKLDIVLSGPRIIQRETQVD